MNDLASRLVDAGFIDLDFYNEQLGDAIFLNNMDAAIHYIDSGEKTGLLPCLEFDPLFYLASNPDLAGVDNFAGHFIEHGKGEGRYGTLASLLIAENLDEIAVEEGLIPKPEVGKGSPLYLRSISKSLRMIDNDLKFFSRKHYFICYPDIENQSIEPFVHYLKYGRHEGRLTSISLSENIFINQDKINSNLPYIVIGVHEASKTGAPIVGMDLAREMRDQYNIIFVSMKDGPLIEDAKSLYPVVIVATESDNINKFFVDFISEKFEVEDAIFSSTACVQFIRPMSLSGCRITCLVHEFLEYMTHVISIVYVCDLLIFSSKELLKSWQYALNDLERDPSTIMVLPQPSSSTSSRVLPKEEARAAVAAATGLDLDGATLVVGAGQIQIRKGTDIFLQVGNQLKREKGKFVSVWIGQPISEFEMSFGVWFHAQLERSRDCDGTLAVHFEPVGPLYSVLMDAADVFLVTSRLDPLPNVALDAGARNVPVIAFAGATGLADLAEQGEIDLIEVQIAAVDEMVAAIKTCAQSSSNGLGAGNAIEDEQRFKVVAE